jgi:hypothetical protein
MPMPKTPLMHRVELRRASTPDAEYLVILIREPIDQGEVSLITAFLRAIAPDIPWVYTGGRNAHS